MIREIPLEKLVVRSFKNKQHAFAVGFIDDYEKAKIWLVAEGV